MILLKKQTELLRWKMVLYYDFFDIFFYHMKDRIEVSAQEKINNNK
jgi:hypothetical protein